jgi:putative transposase
LKVTKSIKLNYSASSELSFLFLAFQRMCNDAIEIASELKPQSRFQLQAIAYPKLKIYGLHSHYILSACEVAYSVWSREGNVASPRIRKPFVKLDCDSYVLNHLILRIPTSARHFVLISLKASKYHLSLIDDPSLKRGSITLAPGFLAISFSKRIEPYRPVGHVGVDTNERNVTWSDTDGKSARIDTSDVPEIRERYREIRTLIATGTASDERKQRKLLNKYGMRERNRCRQRLHSASKKIVDHAKEHNFGIALERFNNIRRLYARGNGQKPLFRGRMNTWAFREFQNQVEYKAKWNGVPVVFVDARGTTQNCSQCGTRVVHLAGRELYCPKCDITWDRDRNASCNIMKAASVVHAAPPPW